MKLRTLHAFTVAVALLYYSRSILDSGRSIPVSDIHEVSSLGQNSTNWTKDDLSKYAYTLYTDMNITDQNTSSYPYGTESSETIPEPFIGFSLIDGARLNNTQVTQYACRNGTTGEPLDSRQDLPTKNPFNFSINIRTNLNILIMGDSLAIEFGSWLQVAAGARNKTIIQMLKWRKSFAEGLTIAHIQGGGSIAYWRILGFWKQESKNDLLPNYGKGWRETWVHQLWSNLQNHTSRRIDVLIFRISHPWLSADEVTTTELKNQISFAKGLLGENLKIIFLSAPVNNNLITDQDFIRFRAMNNLVISFVKTMNKPDILLSDIGSYMDNVIMWNAKQIGINVSDPSYFMLSLKPAPRERLGKHIAQVCSENVPHLSNYCQRNMISNDGMHFCMESLGPRMFANWACLIQCSLKSSSSRCQNACYDKFFVF